jgi:hypothetical protein
MAKGIVRYTVDILVEDNGTTTPPRLDTYSNPLGNMASFTGFSVALRNNGNAEAVVGDDCGGVILRDYRIHAPVLISQA